MEIGTRNSEALNPVAEMIMSKDESECLSLMVWIPVEVILDMGSVMRRTLGRDKAG